MAAATGVVVLITGHRAGLSGLLTRFPVFAAVLAVFTHRVHGAAAAAAVLRGPLLGFLAPAVFFLALACALPSFGLIAFASPGGAALAGPAATLCSLPADHAKGPTGCR